MANFDFVAVDNDISFAFLSSLNSNRFFLHKGIKPSSGCGLRLTQYRRLQDPITRRNRPLSVAQFCYDHSLSKESKKFGRNLVLVLIELEKYEQNLFEKTLNYFFLRIGLSLHILQFV